MSSVSVGPTGEIFVADARVQMFSAKGDFMEVVYDEGRGKKPYFIYSKSIIRSKP